MIDSRTLKFIMVLCLLSGAARAQTVAEAFAGRWHGEGAFSSGKKIAAELTVKSALDNKWCVFEHQDLPPNRYQATSWLGTDPATQAVFCEIFDNFSGHRTYLDNSWQQQQLTLTRKVEGAKTSYYERFIYHKTGHDAFHYSYGTSPNSLAWHTVDSLDFKRIN